MRIQHFQPKDTQDYYLYHLKVKKRLHGKLAESFTVFEENSSGRATFDWKRGQSYLLFVDPMTGNKLYAIDGCGHSNLVDKAESTLREIDALKTLRGGLIEAALYDVKQMSGVTILAIRSDGKHYQASTLADGRVQIRVPPGTYRILPVPAKGFSTDIFSYDDPKNVKIVDGSCAQVLFTQK